MRAENSALMSRLRMQMYQARDFSQIPTWLERNTRDPIHIDRNWSFKDHEFQIEICADTAPELSAQKCSQIGLSETQVRMLFAMMAISKKITIIYILPTSSMATKFVSGRMDPIIEDSPALLEMVDRNLNNTKQKKLGRSLLYISGTIGKSTAISVPAQALFADEVDFCDQKVLSQYNSRLGHSAEGEWLKRQFSTPTVFKYGINKLFISGSQAHRLVKCGHCDTWVDVDYFRDVEIPGLQKSFKEFEREDLDVPGVDIDGAFFRCHHCQEVMKPEWFHERSGRRRWVHKYPDRTMHHSYQILPIDVPAINPLARTLRQIADYDQKKDWVNFKLGLPYEDAASSFLTDVISRAAISYGVLTPSNEAKDKIVTRVCHMGLDVGKTCWLTITSPNDAGSEDVIYQERIRQDGDNYVGRRALQLFQIFNCTSGVVDAGPDISLAAFLTDKGRGRIYACQYVTGSSRNRKLDIIQKMDEETHIVQVHRSGSFDELVRLCNRGSYRFNKASPEYPLALKHLSAMKRVETKDDASGEITVQWIKVEDDDHYAHSANYAMIARMLAGIQPKIEVVPYIPSIFKTKLKQADDDENTKRSWPSSFGV